MWMWMDDVIHGDVDEHAVMHANKTFIVLLNHIFLKKIKNKYFNIFRIFEYFFFL